MGAPVEPVPHDRQADLPEPLRTVADALQRLRYGVIQLTVHDGKPMQLDVTERRCFS